MDNPNKKVTVLTAGGVGNTTVGSGNSRSNSQKKNKKKQKQQQQNSTSNPSPRSVSDKPNDVALSSAAATAATAAAAATMTTTATTTVAATATAAAAPKQEQAQNSSSPPSNVSGVGSLEYHTDEDENIQGGGVGNDNGGGSDSNDPSSRRPYSDYPTSPATSGAGGPQRSSPLQGSPSSAAHAASSSSSTSTSQFMWLFICFFGIMASFVCYGLLLEYATSGGRTLHELSFLFVTSGLYTITAAAGRYVRDETPTTIAPSRFAILGLTSMGSTFFSVRSLRYVIYPIQVLAKSCKPVPVMLMGAIMGKKYPLRKYINVCLIVSGVALFMGGGDKKKKSGGGDDEGTMSSSPSQLIGIILLFISLCFDGGTGAYEDKLMSVHSVQPFDLMYNIQLGKTILAGIGLLVLNQMHLFLQMCQDMGFLLIGLGLSGALGQVFIFVTIAKFGALTCSIIGLARKVMTLVFSIYFYGHHLNGIQFTGLMICIFSMVLDFVGKKKGGGGKGHGGGGHGGGDDNKSATLTSSSKDDIPEELQKMLVDEEQPHDIELTTTPTKVLTAGTIADKK